MKQIDLNTILTNLDEDAAEEILLKPDKRRPNKVKKMKPKYN